MQREEVQVNGNDKGAGVAERSMGYGLRALNWLAGSDLLDRIRVRKQVERALFQGTKRGFRSATAAGRSFKAVQKLARPARQATGKPRSLFDISPDDEQQMFQEAVRDFAAAKVRPASWNICCSSSGLMSKRLRGLPVACRAGRASFCTALKLRPAAVAERKPLLVPWKSARSTCLRTRIRSSRSEPASQLSARRP